jgi:5-methylcytosine-specific restriction endonuclease McrA
MLGGRVSYRSVPRLVKASVIERDGYYCRYCGQELTDRDLTLDHVIPRVEGGPSNVANLVVSCSECNQKKGKKPLQEIKMCLRPISPVLM